MTQSADLIIELLNEEIPSRMQQQGAEAFKSAFISKLQDQGLTSGEAHCYVTPRRIALHIRDLPVELADRYEEKRGPRVGAPEQAIQGFLQSTGKPSLDDCEARSTDKGEFWFAHVHIPGKKTTEVLPQVLQDVVNSFTWPKSMRWAKNTLSWVRPLRAVMCLYNNKGVTGHLDLGDDLLPFTTSTVGHRFMSSTELQPDSYDSYRELLAENFVILDQDARKATIKEGVLKLATEHGYRVRNDEVLLDEVNGLVEWPVPLIGRIDPAFMNLPEEVLMTSMRVHQRYFSVEDQQGKLAPFFVLVANIEPKDGGDALIAGNERVLRARLSDAQFFYQQDQKTPLEDIGRGLSKAIFQEDLGTMAQKVERMTQVSEHLAKEINADTTLVRRASVLSKCDLMSQMVGEFPELQGTMGYYYAKLGGENITVAEALADQYRPKGFADDLPRSDVGRIVALSDKIDTLVGFFSIGIKPTGSKDPFALRRAAIGCIRLMQTMPGLKLDNLVQASYQAYQPIFAASSAEARPLDEVASDLKDFFFDRLKAYGRERGIRHDVLDAVFAVAGSDAFDVIDLRVTALNNFLTRGGDLGERLLAAYRRASNIVRIEEKKDQVTYSPRVSADLLKEDAENHLHKALMTSHQAINDDIETHDFEKAMAVLAELRPYIDEFFEKVTVNTDDRNLRENRLRLLSLIRDTLHQVADFSKIEG